MSLLEKFDAVVVQADNRISETDKYFCETHQEAYEAALTSFKELGFFWEDMLKTQSDLLGPRHTDFFYDYLSSSKGPSISNHSIQAHIKSLHGEFIQTLVHHFNSAYHVTVSSSDVKKALLPEEPDSYRRGNEEEWDAYDEAMQTLTVKYADVVDQVILRLDGRNFMEQAFYELKTSCHKAAWNTYKQEPDFERKKDTIRFTGYGCSYDTWSNVTRWELSDSMKSILRGAAHFETGGYNMYPVGLSDLVGYGRIDHDLVLFPSCTKLKQPISIWGICAPINRRCVLIMWWETSISIRGGKGQIEMEGQAGNGSRGSEHLDTVSRCAARIEKRPHSARLHGRVGATEYYNFRSFG